MTVPDFSGAHQNENRVAVILVNYHSEQFLQPCLEAVAKQSLKPDRLIVVDNGSNRDRLERIVQGYPRAELLPMPDAEVTFYLDFFGSDESEKLFQQLVDNIQWKQESARFGGKAVPLPRLTAWYGDASKIYRYSGITVEPIAGSPGPTTPRVVGGKLD